MEILSNGQKLMRIIDLHNEISDLHELKINSIEDAIDIMMDVSTDSEVYNYKNVPIDILISGIVKYNKGAIYILDEPNDAEKYEFMTKSQLNACNYNTVNSIEILNYFCNNLINYLKDTDNTSEITNIKIDIVSGIRLINAIYHDYHNLNIVKYPEYLKHIDFLSMMSCSYDDSKSHEYYFDEYQDHNAFTPQDTEEYIEYLSVISNTFQTIFLQHNLQKFNSGIEQCIALYCTTQYSNLSEDEFKCGLIEFVHILHDTLKRINPMSPIKVDIQNDDLILLTRN